MSVRGEIGGRTVAGLFRGALAFLRSPGADRAMAHGVVDLGERRAAGAGYRSLAGTAGGPRALNDRLLTRDPIDIASGEVVLRQRDAELPGVLPLVVERTHLSSYRAGKWFGRSWASTLDQRVEVGAATVSFAADDGAILRYPRPEETNAPVLPDAGRRWPLRLTARDACTISDPTTGRTWHFASTGDAAGVLLLCAVTDRNGNRVDVERDASGAPVALVHSCGYRIAVDVRGGRVRALRLVPRHGGHGEDAEGGITLVRYGYDDAGNLAEVVNSSGLPVRFRYDDDGRMTEWTDRRGHGYRYVYDEAGRAVRGGAPGGYLDVTLAYDPENRSTSLTDSLGRTTTYRFNELGQVVGEVDPLGAETRFTWNRHDQMLSRTDPLGRHFRYVHDDAGNPTALIRPDGRRIRVRYDGRGRPVAITGPDGGRWRYRYDEAGNPTAAVDPTGAVTRYGRDARGGLTSVTDPLGHETRIACDAAGLPIEITDPLGAVTSVRRDAFGRVVSITDPAGGETRIEWNTEGRPISRVTPSGAAERWRYDAEGNLVEHVDATGRTTRVEYGPFDLPVARIGPDGSRHAFGYDTELRLTSVRNPQGLTWRYDYDAAGGLIGETDFNGRVLAYRRDLAGQLVERVDGTGASTRFVRDSLGNVIETRSRAGTARSEDAAVPGEVVTSFAYDPAGRLTRATNADADVRFVRDPLGRVVAETCNGRSVTSAFDAVGRRVRRTTPSGAAATWEYDAAGRPVTMTTAGRSLTFAYDPVGREVERRLGAGVSLVQAFDGDHRLLDQTVTVTSPAGPVVPSPDGARDQRVLQHRSYRYRPDGHLLAVTDLLGGTRRFDLDPIGRVTAVHGDGPYGRDRTERYAYDPGGNVTDAAWPPSPGEETGERGGREYDGTLIRRAGDVRYEHDRQGRVTRRRRRTLSGRVREWRYTWDGEDRLTEVVLPGGERWRYRYDAFGRRIAKQRLGDRGQIAAQIDFVWDGAVLAEVDDGDRTTTWVHDGIRPLTQTEHRPAASASQEEIDERFYAIVGDLVGAPAEMVDADGDLVWRRQATLWGTTSAVTAGGVDCPLRFPGQYHDPETGLDYNVHRYYDPATGRYQSADPLGLTPQPNPHAYVHNPTFAVDPLGLMGCRSGGPLTLNLGGEGEVAGAINLNTLVAPLRSIETIRASGPLVQGSMERIPFADGTFDRVVGNKMPFMHGEFAENVTGEAFRVLAPGGTVELAASNVGGAAWVPYLEKAYFQNIRVQGRYAMGVRP